ncbi:hypothetical protein [Streptacidiphilus fuscans]|uniref:Uncharacterized protein n=1 Tax=Streptacidiphilus fuscans TaxID=2789292 RepID=A0A931B7H7_9ACTN|nr:hypothetical protein [Streptacidiphilus fuscans]MBF9070092.1 hypothetical protein [Streptacidiphilus fuscans]
MSNRTTPPRWPVVSLRVTAVLVALLAVAQPVLAGGFLQGFYPLLNAHMIAAMILATAALLAAIAGLLVWRLSGGPNSFAIHYAIMVVACAAQISLGFDRVLILHIPLGVGIFVMAEKFAVDVFTFKPGASVGAGAGDGDGDGDAAESVEVSA